MLQIINGSVLFEGQLLRSNLSLDGTEIDEISQDDRRKGATLDAKDLRDHPLRVGLTMDVVIDTRAK